MIRCLCFFIIWTLSLTAFAGKDLKWFNKKTDAFFKAHVKEGKMNYIYLGHFDEELWELVDHISTMDYSSLQGKKLKAYLINVYNILVIFRIQVEQRGEQKYVHRDEGMLSPIEDARFYKIQINIVGGKSMSLNELKEMIMGVSRDFRVYSLLSPGTMNGPALPSYVYKASGLNRKLKQGMKRIASDRNFVRKISKPPLILLSDIFLGYDRFFSKEEMVAAFNKYREEPLPLDFKADFFPSSCNLNAR
jgi:hypothetical protein